MHTRSLVGLVVAIGALVGAAPASAIDLLSQSVSAASAVDKSCTSGARSGTGVATKSFSMPAAGWVTAKLSASGGDWDLAIFDKADGRVVAGSASSGASEIASGLRRPRAATWSCRRAAAPAARRAPSSASARRPWTRAASRRSRSCACRPRPRSARTSSSGSGSTSPSTAGRASSRSSLHGAADTEAARRQRLRLHHRGRRTWRSRLAATAPPTRSSRPQPRSPSCRAAGRPTGGSSTTART